MLADQPLEKVPTGFVGEIQVNHCQVHVPSARNLECFAGIGSAEHCVGFILQHAREHPAHRRIIVHQQNLGFHQRTKKYPVAGRGREPSHRERWVAAKSSRSSELLRSSIQRPAAELTSPGSGRQNSFSWNRAIPARTRFCLKNRAIPNSRSSPHSSRTGNSLTTPVNPLIIEEALFAYNGKAELTDTAIDLNQ